MPPSLLQLYPACFIHSAVPTVAMPQIESDSQFCCEIFLLSLVAAVLPCCRFPFYLLCLEHVDTLGAYSIPPETGLLICPRQ
jgi:hypothetical protein